MQGVKVELVFYNILNKDRIPEEFLLRVNTGEEYL